MCINNFSNQTAWRKANLACKIAIDNSEKDELLRGGDPLRQRYVIILFHCYQKLAQKFPTSCQIPFQKFIHVNHYKSMLFSFAMSFVRCSWEARSSLLLISAPALNACLRLTLHLIYLGNGYRIFCTVRRSGT